jgi:CrcB protein
MAGSDAGEPIGLFLGTGFMGAFTTFSTFKLESFNLYRRRERAAVLLYMGLMYGLGIGAAWLGFRIGL